MRQRPSQILFPNFFGDRPVPIGQREERRSESSEVNRQQCKKLVDRELSEEKILLL